MLVSCNSSLYVHLSFIVKVKVVSGGYLYIMCQNISVRWSGYSGCAFPCILKRSVTLILVFDWYKHTVGFLFHFNVSFAPALNMCPTFWPTETQHLEMKQLLVSDSYPHENGGTLLNRNLVWPHLKGQANIHLFIPWPCFYLQSCFQSAALGFPVCLCIDGKMWNISFLTNQSCCSLCRLDL